MALLAATLATELKALDLYDTEAEALTGWAAAYKKYMEGASSNGVPIVAASLVPAEAAFIGAGTGLSTGAATALQAAILAFWGAIVPATAWPTVTVITPPALLSGLATALTSVFTANTEGGLAKDASMEAIATAMHTNSLGGTATWPTPVGPQPII